MNENLSQIPCEFEGTINKYVTASKLLLEKENLANLVCGSQRSFLPRLAAFEHCLPTNFPLSLSVVSTLLIKEFVSALATRQTLGTVRLQYMELGSLT